MHRRGFFWHLMLPDASDPHPVLRKPDVRRYQRDGNKGEKLAPLHSITSSNATTGQTAVAEAHDGRLRIGSAERLRAGHRGNLPVDRHKPVAPRGLLASRLDRR